MNPEQIERLRWEYTHILPRLEKFLEALHEQIEVLLSKSSITLAVPITGRVKSWRSLVEKINRNSLALETITDLTDLVGLRLIILFRCDTDAVHDVLNHNFSIKSSEDTAVRLGTAEFGYQSRHYLVSMPDSWLSVPSIKDFCDMHAEIQVRTLAQHLWAAASHKLQYKVKSSVPTTLRRRIYRLSAHLETVDEELDQILNEREIYANDIVSGRVVEPLNVDNVSALLKTLFPEDNLDVHEPYADLVQNLNKVGITTTDQLVLLVKKHLQSALSYDQFMVNTRRSTQSTRGTSSDRLSRGVYFSHVGLARHILVLEFEEQWRM